MQSDWVQQALAQQEASFQRATPKQALSFEKRDGWTFKGMEFRGYPPPGYEWDPKLVRAIQDLFPDFQPLWVNYVYISPKEEGNSNREYVTFGRHAYGRVISDPRVEVIPIPIKMPSRRTGYGFKMRPATKIEDVMRGAPDPRAKDLPGAYMKFDWWLINWLKENWREWSIKEIRAVNAQAEEDYYASLDQKAAAQSAHVQERLIDYWDKKRDSVSDQEMKEYFLKGSS